MKGLLLLFIIIPVDAVLYSDGKRLNEYLLANYSRRLHPRINLNEPVTVNVDLFLNSVIDFDVLTGILTFAGTFSLTWDDEQIASRWNNSEFNDITMTQLNVHEIWVPKIYIRNLVEQTSIFQFSSTFDSESTFVSFSPNGTARTTLVTVLQTSCTTDITYYPFDKHSCDLSVITLNLYSTVILRTSLTTLLNIYTIENSEWSISSSVYSGISGPFSNAIYDLNLTRKPYFLVLNLVCPSIIICTVNSLSFLIPVASGERVSFCVSLLLTYIVFLTTVLDKLPSTDTVSLFNIFLFVQLIYSSLTALGIIKTLGYYHYEGNIVVPVAYKNIVRFVLRCNCKVKISPNTTTTSKTSTEDHSSFSACKNNDENKMNLTNGDLKDNKDDTADLDSDYDNIAWRDVARALDRIINIIATFVAMLNLILFFVIMIRLQTE
ncbi:HTR3 [Mytilus coruscus]|uniref:HTR3 n=1 Tax=Mytilus coruscus TaxID=42192 RepID=A0A6J8CM28_MYTCO|nr:HTR3 [Mytilus coruscus]